MSLKEWIIFGLVAAMLSGCGLREWVFGAPTPDAVNIVPFRTSLSRGADRRDFTITIRAQGASLDEARESARFRATRYCIERYGGSVVAWTMDPLTGDWAAEQAGENLIVGGRCMAR